MVIQHLNSSTLDLQIGLDVWTLELRTMPSWNKWGQITNKANVSKLIADTPSKTQEPTNTSFQGACISNLIYELGPSYY
jgi:hypothetical protein